MHGCINHIPWHICYMSNRISTLRWRGWCPHPSPAVTAERGCSFDSRRSAVWPNLTSSCRTSLASNSPAHHFQDSTSGVEMSTRQSAALPCRSVHSDHFSRGKASIALCNDWNPFSCMPRVRTSTGQRSFAVFGPATWNSLPPSLRAAPELSLSTFKRLLKTQLFQHAWTIVRLRCDWTASSAPHTIIRTQLNSTFDSWLYAVQINISWSSTVARIRCYGRRAEFLNSYFLGTSRVYFPLILLLK